MVLQEELRDEVGRLADELEVPGTAVGVLVGDTTDVAFHGVTSVEDPLPVNQGTLFQIGSTGKTYTATAIVQLADGAASI